MPKLSVVVDDRFCCFMEKEKSDSNPQFLIEPASQELLASATDSFVPKLFFLGVC